MKTRLKMALWLERIRRKNLKALHPWAILGRSLGDLWVIIG